MKTIYIAVNNYKSKSVPEMKKSITKIVEEMVNRNFENASTNEH